MKNLSVSFAGTRGSNNTQTQTGVADQALGQTAQEFCKGKTNVIYRGVSTDCQTVFDAGETKDGLVKSFLLKPVYDYSTTPRTKTDEQKLHALVTINNVTFAVSLGAHQTHIRLGQTVSVRSNSEFFEPSKDRKTLSAEILD